MWRPNPNSNGTNLEAYGERAVLRDLPWALTARERAMNGPQNVRAPRVMQNIGAIAVISGHIVPVVVPNRRATGTVYLDSQPDYMRQMR